MEFSNPSHNVHGVIKEQLRAIMVTYIKAKEKLEAGKRKRDTIKSTNQTTKVTLNNVKRVTKGPENDKLRSEHRKSNREITEEASKRKKNKAPQKTHREATSSKACRRRSESRQEIGGPNLDEG